LCTYMGLGTEFVRNEDADRRLWARTLGADTGGYGLKREDRVLTAAPGDVVYLKGHAYPGNEGQWFVRPTLSDDVIGRIG
jgi:hypothetical protein